MVAREKIYLLWHAHPLNENKKLIGVFSTSVMAHEGIAKLSIHPEFRDSLQGLEIIDYQLDQVEWTEGFTTAKEVLDAIFGKGDENDIRTNGRLHSDVMAELIIDALVDAGIVTEENFKRAVEIATEEIDVRKAAGDY